MNALIDWNSVRRMGHIDCASDRLLIARLQVAAATDPNARDAEPRLRTLGRCERPPRAAVSEI